jgi:tetratricopeptide (TPR) repeat protein
LIAPTWSELAGAVLLTRGDFALARSSGRDQALADVRAALARGLDPASAAYARGLLAEYPDEALGHFEEALRLDPFHHNANTALLMVLFCLGRLDECTSRAQALSLLYPEDPTPNVVRAFAQLLNGNAAGARARFDEIKAQLGETKTKLLEELLTAFKEVLQGMGGSTVSPWQVLKVMSLSSKFQGTSDLAPLGLTFVNLPALANSWGVLLGAHRQLLSDHPREATEQLEKVLDHHPEATFYFYHAHSVVLQVDGKSAEERLRLFRKAERSYRLAADAPCLVRASARESRYWAAYAEAILGGGQGRSDSEMHARAVDNMRFLLYQGKPTVDECKQLASEALTRLHEHDLARALVAEALRQAPGNVSLLLLRAQIELAAGAYHPAIEAANQALARKPADSGALRLRKEAGAKLRELSKSVLLEE